MSQGLGPTLTGTDSSIDPGKIKKSDSLNQIELSPRERALTTIGVLFGIFLAAIEGTVVATAMPTATSALGSTALIHYVFASYHLATVSTIVLWGKSADVWGLRRSFFLGCFFFLLGSALCGISQNVYQLILCRFIQGIGAGAIYPIAQTTLGAIYSEVKRAKMQVYLSVVWAIASIIGPPIGALLTEQLSWRWVFYLNLPAGIISIALVQTGLRRHQQAIDLAQAKSFDWIGSTLVSLGVMTTIAAISVDRNGKFIWSLSTIAALIAISAAALVLFFMHIKKSSNPFISPTILKNPVLRKAGVGSFLMCMATFGTINFIPLYCQVGLRQSVGASGRTLTAFLFGWIITSGIAARAYLRYSMRTLARLGTAIMTLAFFYLSFHLKDISTMGFRANLFFLGTGMGICFAPILLGVQSVVAKHELGSGTASLQLLRNMGGLFGVTLLGTLLALDLNGFSPILGGAAIHENAQIAMTRVFLADSFICLLALISMWGLPPILPKN